ncbi:MAG: PLP-dependent transferase [Syntrophobacteraceae bacterium]
MEELKTQFETLAIHGARAPEPRMGAATIPIYQTSTFRQDRIGGLRCGFEYARAGNPTRQALEAAIVLRRRETFLRSFTFRFFNGLSSLRQHHCAGAVGPRALKALLLNAFSNTGSCPSENLMLGNASLLPTLPRSAPGAGFVGWGERSEPQHSHASPRGGHIQHLGSHRLHDSGFRMETSSNWFSDRF